VAQHQLQDRDITLAQTKPNMIKAQEYMKIQADKHRHEVHFQVGDNVLVRL